MNEKSNQSTKSDSQKNYGESNKLPQYIAALSVCMGSVAAGTVLGWTGNITQDDLEKGGLNNITINPDDYGWIGSFSNLGGLCICFPIGIICDLIGRKKAMLSTIVLFTIGWLLIIFANAVGMIFAGRFLTGLAGGAFCVAAPLYTSEIAEKEIRGALGSYFQLLLTVGILFVYILGAYCEPQITSIVCAIVPFIFGVLFFLQPETPIYLMKKGKEAGARAALKKLRGPNYNIDLEINDIKANLEKEKLLNISFIDSLKKTSSKKSLLYCFALMFFQQFSGINAVIFYVGDIFKDAESGMSATDAPILVGGMQVMATFVSSLVIDKFGRKILLILSDSIMAVSGIMLAIYFTLKDRDLISDEDVKNIGFLPILAVCIFIVMFSLGYGPIPWMISAELLPPEIKSIASSGAGSFNWLLAFIVTKFYGDLNKAVGGDTTFYIFAGISICGTIFVWLFIPETKGKSLQEIQQELNGETSTVMQDTEGIDNQGFSN